MFDGELMNITLAEYCTGISRNITPDDIVFINYKAIMAGAGLVDGYEHDFYTPLINKMMTLLPTVYSRYTTAQVSTLLDSILTKINLLVSPINIPFFKNFLENWFLLNNDANIPINEKIALCEACGVHGEICNISFELEYHSRLLNIYLYNLPTSIDKLQPTSEKVKELKALKDNLPSQFGNV